MSHKPYCGTGLKVNALLKVTMFITSYNNLGKKKTQYDVQQNNLTKFF